MLALAALALATTLPARALAPPPAPSTLSAVPADASPAEAQAWKLLLAGVADNNAEHRSYALAALTSIGPAPPVVAALESALDSPDAALREQAAESLGALDARSSAAKLRPLLQDKSNAVVLAAATTLSGFGDAAGRHVLVEFMTGERRAAPGMVGAGADWVKQEATPKTLLLSGAGYASSVFLGPGSIGVLALIQIIRNRSTDGVRARSAEALGANADADTLRLLEKELADRNWKLRAAAAEALGTAGAPASVPPLQASLRDRSPIVRYMAAAAILRIGYANPK